MKIGVVAHISRVRLADKLIRKVHAECCSVDKGHYGPQVNHHRVWSRLAKITEPNEWAIVLEDDAVVQDGFREQAQAAFDSLPYEASLASLYLGQKRPPHWQERVAQAVGKARAEDASWIVSEAVLHGVAICMRGNMIHNMLDFVTRDSSLPIDDAIRYFSQSNSVECWYSHPSIVDHMDVPTIVKHPDGEIREKGRVAWDYGQRKVWTARWVRM